MLVLDGYLVLTPPQSTSLPWRVPAHYPDVTHITVWGRPEGDNPATITLPLLACSSTLPLGYPDTCLRTPWGWYLHHHHPPSSGVFRHITLKGKVIMFPSHSRGELAPATTEAAAESCSISHIKKRGLLLISYSTDSLSSSFITASNVFVAHIWQYS